MSDWQWHWWTGPRVYSCKVNDETDAFVRAAYKLSGMTFPLTQGSTFGAGNGATASAGTHNGTSVVDFSVTGKTVGQIKRFVTWLRKLGAAAWYRPYLKGVWPSHIHCVIIGLKGLAAGAADQVYWFKKKRTGLRGEAIDRMHEWVGATTWPKAKKKYAKELAGAKPTPQKKGLFGMGSVKRGKIRKTIMLVPDVELTIPINEDGDVSILTGPTDDFNVNVQLKLGGLPVGASVGVRAYSIDFKSGQKDHERIWNSEYVEIIGTAGNTYGQAVFDGNLGKAPAGYSRRLRVGVKTDRTNVAILQITTNARKA